MVEVKQLNEATTMDKCKFENEVKPVFRVIHPPTNW